MSQGHAEPAVVAVVGSTNTDLVTYLQQVPSGGQTVLGERFATGFGGKGANQAVMASRLGVRVRLVACVGEDSFGDRTLEHLAAQGVEIDDVQRRPGSSGVAPIWVEPDGTNRIVVVPGANALVSAEQVTASLDGLPRLDVVVGQLEIPQPITLVGFQRARARGAVTVLNPAPAAPLVPGLLAVTDWLVPNEGELAEVARTAGTAGALGRAANPDDDDALSAMATALGCGLAVTLGERGVAVVPPGTSAVLRIEAERVAARDTTGAGDAFVGAFAAALAHGLAPAAAAAWACRCATASVQRDGAQASYPTAADVSELRP